MQFLVPPGESPSVLLYFLFISVLNKLEAQCTLGGRDGFSSSDYKVNCYRIRKAAATDQSINSKDDSREGATLSKEKSVESREKSSESKENLDDDRKRGARLAST